MCRSAVIGALPPSLVASLIRRVPPGPIRAWVVGTLSSGPSPLEGPAVQITPISVAGTVHVAPVAGDPQLELVRYGVLTVPEVCRHVEDLPATRERRTGRERRRTQQGDHEQHPYRPAPVHRPTV